MKRNLITSAAKRILLKSGYFQLEKNAHTSFSQMGEDLILERIFYGRKRGFYVDIGAFHPRLYSNTYLFYLKGWTGINVDAMPGSMAEFDKIRPKDKNLEAVVSDKTKAVKYFLTNSGALNTISNARKKEIDTMVEHKVTGQIMVKTITLKSLLGKHLPKRKKIDLLNVDVEGVDLDVLKSNDWKKYRPEVIVVESLKFSLEHPDRDDIYNFLKSKNYGLTAKLDASLIFQSKK